MNLTEAIVVRVSHDLAGAIGAFSNTVDLMKMDASFISESVDLLETSAHQLTARLAFFRALFGAETKSIDAHLIHRYLNTLAVRVEFSGELSSRLQLAMVAVGIELLGVGGVLELSNQTLTVHSKELYQDPVFMQALMGTKVPCDPKLVMPLWLNQIAKEEGLIIRLDAGDDTITLSLA